MKNYRKGSTKNRQWRSRLRKWLPSSERVKKNKFVNWLGPTINHSRLWQLNRHGVALGLAIGLFFGFLIPFLQIPFAAFVAVWLRANLLVTVVSTLISNPFTYAPIYFFAYQVGSLLIGDTQVVAAQNTGYGDNIPDNLDTNFYAVLAHFFSLGKPLFLGLGTLAVVAGAVAYVGVLLIWRLIILVEWNHRKARR